MVAQPVLFGIDESLQLLIVHPSDGSVEAIGEPLDFDLFGPCPAMAFGPPGLFAVCYDAQQGDQVLVRIDPGTAQAVRIEPDRLHNVTDIAFRSDGLLFGWQSESPPGSQCFGTTVGKVIRIDTEDGSSLPLGESELPACEGFFAGLAFDAADRLYLSYSQLGIVDQSSGKVTSLMPFGFAAEGLDFHPLDGTLVALGDIEPALFAFEISTGELKELTRLSTTLTAIAFSPSPNLILANLVSGPTAGGAQFRSLLTMINRSGSTLQPAIELFGNDGSKLDEEQGSTLEPQGTAILALDRPSEFNGWAQVSWTASAEVQAALEVMLCGQVIPEVGVIPFPTRPIITSVQSAVLPQAHTLTAPGVITSFRESAFALVNPSASESALVEVHALRADGQSFDINEFQIPPRGRVSLLLFELLNFGKVFIRPPDRPIDYFGSVHIRSDLPIAVTGLTVLLPEGKWTGLPVEPGAEF